MLGHQSPSVHGRNTLNRDWETGKNNAFPIELVSLINHKGNIIYQAKAYPASHYIAQVVQTFDPLA